MTLLLILFVILVLVGGGVWAWPLLAGALGIANVTDKAGALQYIAQLARTYDIQLDEIKTALLTPDTTNTLPERRKGELAKHLFIYLGAIFIFAGIATYIGMFWDSMGSIMRVFCTLGVGYVLLILLVSALHENKFPKLILPVTLLCASVMTGGWFVLIDEFSSGGDNWRLATLIVFGIMALQFGPLFGKYRRTVLAITTLFFIYGFMQVGLDLVGMPRTYIAIVLGASVFLVATALEKTPHRIMVEPAILIGVFWLNSGLFELMANTVAPDWAGLLTGLCIMSTAFGLQKEGRYPRLVGLGYLVGSFMFYAGLFDLLIGTPVELLYLAVTVGLLYTCLHLQSRALLLTTVIAMLTFIGYFSAEYFANSLGWPITLVLMGVAFLGVGAIAIKVKQRLL